MEGKAVGRSLNDRSRAFCEPGTVLGMGQRFQSLLGTIVEEERAKGMMGTTSG